jgi:hypothetical protein
MTIDEAIELAAFFTGGSVGCDVCQCTPYHDFMATRPPEGYDDDVVFGEWLLAHGGDFGGESIPTRKGLNGDCPSSRIWRGSRPR